MTDPDTKTPEGGDPTGPATAASAGSGHGQGPGHGQGQGHGQRAGAGPSAPGDDPTADAQPDARDAALARAVGRAIAAQRDFVGRRPTKVGRGLDRLTAPVAEALRGRVPVSVLRNALQGTDTAAGLTMPAGPPAHDTDDIDACEAAALRVQAWSAGGNAATGGAAGLMGGLGLTLDIPATLSLAARNVRATGAAYGFGEDTEDERAFRLMILELAAVRGLEARADSLDRVNVLARHLTNPLARAAASGASDWLVETVVERVARQLGVSLLQRKAAQVVPVLGGIVAATVNAGFQTDVSRAARYAYRQRWLMARRMLPGPDGAPDGAPESAPEDAPDPASETPADPPPSQGGSAT